MTDDARPPWWKNPLSWAAVLFVGLAVYELTANPMLGTALVCIKFGWEDWRAAVWLVHRDPDRRRGNAHFWLYLSSGLWKVALTGTVMLLGLYAVIARQRANQQPLDQSVSVLFGASWSALGGFTVSLCTTAWAMGLAMHNGLKLWLDGGLHRDRRADVWPPHPSALGRFNWAGVLFLIPLIFVYLLLIPGLFGLAMTLTGSGVVACLAGSGTLVGGGILLVRFYNFITRRTLAKSPGECWGAGGDEEWDAEPVTDYGT